MGIVFTQQVVNLLCNIENEHTSPDHILLGDSDAFVARILKILGDAAQLCTL